MEVLEAIEQPGKRLKVIEGGKISAKVDPLDKLEHGKPIRQHIREFGAVMALVMTIIAAFQINKPGGVSLAFGLVAAGLLTWFIGTVAPKILHKPWEAWMAFAHVLGIVMTTLLLSITWIAMVIPISICLRIFGIKVMDSTFRAPVETYWDDRDEKLSDFKLLERQY